MPEPWGLEMSHFISSCSRLQLLGRVSCGFYPSKKAQSLTWQLGIMDEAEKPLERVLESHTPPLRLMPGCCGSWDKALHWGLLPRPQHHPQQSSLGWPGGCSASSQTSQSFDPSIYRSSACCSFSLHQAR